MFVRFILKYYKFFNNKNKAQLYKATLLVCEYKKQSI